MSNRAEAALEERYKSNPRHTPSHHYYKRGFLDGYAAASDDCEAQVREGVKAALEKAASTGDGWTIQITDDVCYISTQDASKIGEHQVRFIVERIRALDPEPIVRRVMQQ